MQNTFSIIKPDATKRNLTGSINMIIENSGLKVDSYEKLALGTVAIYKCSKNSKNS